MTHNITMIQEDFQFVYVHLSWCIYSGFFGLFLQEKYYWLCIVMLDN